MKIEVMEQESTEQLEISQKRIPREYSEFDVAIIGLSGRFPGADSVDEFWQNLCAGEESITFFSDEELQDAGIAPETYNKPNYVKAAPILNNPAHFDASFFGYSPREAAATDPQHRLFLECAWQALESAGYDVDRINAPVGVFGGAAMNTYLLHSGLLPEFSSNYLPTLIGNDNSFLATRVSYKLNLTGPSMTVQTACSSSLVAVHTACQSLLNQECDMALAGGASVRVPHHAGHLHQEYSVFSPDGHCRTFDAKAQGTIFGSGVGMILLKRLEDAMADQDTIYAIVKGSAINNDGSSKVDYTAPSVNSQSHVITEAMASADVTADTISYIEAHGTGTNLGDPIEISALTKAFRNHTDRKQFCAIGSAKTNIGHLDAAAGIAGLIKTVMALKYKKIPASLHYETPNPQIDFAQSPFFVNTATREWSVTDNPRRAGVSSLGIGGTNAHIILEEAPYDEGKESVQLNENKQPQTLLLSARNEAVLDTYSATLADYLDKQPNVNLVDVSYTLREGRKQFEHRQAVVCTDIEDAIKHLTDPDSKQAQRGAKTSDSKEIVFMFPGQGAQYMNMGRELYEKEAIFRNAVDRCSEILSQHLSQDIRSLLYPSIMQDRDTERVDEQTELNETAWAQPAIFTVEYAMAQLLLSWGIRPTLVVGHSIGEYAAGCIAGIFSLEDALKLVAARGRLMQSLPPGAMMAVNASVTDIERFLGKDLAVAAINSATRIVVSGTFAAIDELDDSLKAAGIASQKLHTSHAFHSPMVTPIVDEFTQLASTIQFSPAQTAFASTVLGGIAQDNEYQHAEYWAKNIRQTVRFADAATELLGKPSRIYLEVGPGTTLSTFIRQHELREAQQLILSSIRHPKDPNSDVMHILGILNRLWIDGVDVEWQTIYTAGGRRVALPTYPFEHKSHWYRAKKPSFSSKSIRQITEQRLDFEKWFLVPSWKRTPLPRSISIDNESKWLIFVGHAGIGEEIVQFVPNSNSSCVKVYQGNSFEQLSANEFSLNPDNATDYERLLDSLADTDRYPTKIAYLWGLAAPNPSIFADVDLEAGLAKFQNIFYLAKAIGIVSTAKEKQHTKIQLAIISNQLYDVNGTETLRPEDALLLGPCRVIGKEYPQIECTNFDLAFDDERGDSKLFRAIVCELTQPSCNEQIVAYRGGHRWVEIFEPVQLDEEEPLATSASFVENGVYLITGGLGGVGYALAEFLAKNVQAKLVLLGRSSLPERGEWDTWLREHEPSEAIVQKIQRILALEENGATVLPICADVADEAQMKAAVVQVKKTFGAIHGAIHAAGIIKDGLITNKEMSSVHEVLNAKVNGTLILQNVLKGEELNFLALCSSINSILAPAGQVDYVAANSFLDHFAHYNTSRMGINTVSINWPGWQDVGMLASMDDSPWKQRALKEAISSTDAIEAFKRIIASKQPQMVVSPIRFQQESIPVRDVMAALSSTNAENDAPLVSESHVKANSITDSLASQNGATEFGLHSAEKLVADLWEECLGVENVKSSDDFFELGGSSLLAVQMFAKIEEATGQNFPISTLYQASTARQMAILLGDYVPDALPSEDSLIDEQASDIIADSVPSIQASAETDATIAKNTILRSIVPIQDKGDASPMFLMHAAGGNVLMYRALAKHLGKEQPVYGLQSLGLTDGGTIHKTIEEMARYYADEIIATETAGPYLLGGFCMGGAIALETAQVLQNMGKEVSCVLLLDSFNVASIENEHPFINYCFLSLQLAQYHWKNFWQLDRAERQQYAQRLIGSVATRARLTLRMLKPSGAEQVAKEADGNRLQSVRLTDIWQANEDAGRGYQPDEYRGRIALFKQYSRFGYSDALGWETVAKSGVDIRYFPPFPEVFVNEPYAQTLAYSLKDYLQRLE